MLMLSDDASSHPILHRGLLYTPVLLRLGYTSDTTIEQLGELLADAPRGLLLARDELDAWFGSFTRYRGKGSTDRPQWLELHKAGTLIIDRMTRERKRLAVRRAAVSVCGTIQPAILASTLDLDALQA